LADFHPQVGTGLLHENGELPKSAHVSIQSSSFRISSAATVAEGNFVIPTAR
jgi:hypothetical protein